MPNYEPTPVRRGQLPSAELMENLQEAASFGSRAGGYGVAQYPDGTVFQPPDIEEIWAIVSGQGSGSYYGSGSGSATSDNRYAWNQGLVSIAANGDETVIVDASGLVGTQDSNPLIEVNGATDVPAGYVTRAYRSPSGNAWLFVFGGEGGTGSGNSQTIHCPNGNQYAVTISGTNVTVTPFTSNI